MSKPVLGYWDFRGYAQQHRLLLTYLGVDFEDKRYDLYGPGGMVPTKQFWLADKFCLGLDFPNLPYWIDDQVKLTESKAILKYIAKTRGGGVLFPQTPESQAVADMVDGVVFDMQQAFVILARSKSGVPETPIQENQGERFRHLNDFLAKRKWAIGDDLSYVDFFVYEVLKEYVKYDEDFMNPYPALVAYMTTFEELPQLTEYIKSTDKLISYSPWATLTF